MVFYAHSRSGPVAEDWDLLEDHLLAVAERSEEFSRAFASGAGHIAGLWHDLGKYQEAFQKYIRKDSEGGFHDAPHVKHSFVGALHAFHHLPGERLDIPAVIGAHHGRLPNAQDVYSAMQAQKPPIPGAPAEILKGSLTGMNNVSHPPAEAQALWTRFLYSALVDADSLVTEEWDRGRPRWRSPLSPGDLLPKLERHLAELAQDPGSEMNPLRRQVQDACRNMAEQPPGAFRLTVPTGGGKTLASLLFALRHASLYGLRRVIVVIPYTSIIDQTAHTYRNIFGGDAVLEHHSNIDPSRETLRNRHCVENWDSPIVVTTSVQFFESLYGNRKRDLRKLHNIAESVVVLDEVQTFPSHLIRPIGEALERLTDHFKVSTVHCSATQPMLAQPGAREIIPEPKQLFAITRHRVCVDWPADTAEPTSWEALAQRIRNESARDESSRQVLAIVHAKRDALDLAQAVGEDCIHLSTLMCAKHRRKVLEGIKTQLKDDLPCLVVSTQLVEAGVDIDFPVVYRALAGVDSLAQAAGRCNREGKLAKPGDFHIFVAPSKPPLGSLRHGWDKMKELLHRGPVDPFDPELPGRYFAELMRKFPSREESPISEAESKMRFQEVADSFQMIEDHGTPVIAPYNGWAEAVRQVREFPGIQAYRKLQPYTVSVPDKLFTALRSTGALVPLTDQPETPEREKCWVVLGGHEAVYSQRFGFGGDGEASVLPFLGEV